MVILGMTRRAGHVRMTWPFPTVEYEKEQGSTLGPIHHAADSHHFPEHHDEEYPRGVRHKNVELYPKHLEMFPFFMLLL
jgi:hypothetical protein